jgi:hypothetical protein
MHARGGMGGAPGNEGGELGYGSGETDGDGTVRIDGGGSAHGTVVVGPNSLPGAMVDVPTPPRCSVRCPHPAPWHNGWCPHPSPTEWVLAPRSALV